jgi:hypothetical protein
MDRETTGSELEVVVWVTFTVMLPVMVPVNPGAVAVTRMLLQVLLPEVMSPVLLTVTHAGVELAQVTESVMSRVVAGWLPWV